MFYLGESHPQVADPDAYPSLRLISTLKAPLLVLHGDRDDVVPLTHGQALFAAAREPKRIRMVDGLGHSDLVARAGHEYVDEIASCATRLDG